MHKVVLQFVQSDQTTDRTRFHYVDRYAWGLGQDLGDYEGELLVHRFGSLNGAFSHISFMPQRRIGVIVLTNANNGLADAVAAYAYDRLLDKPALAAKWKPEVQHLAEITAKERASRMAAQPASKTPAHALSEYAGRYHYDRLGDIALGVEDARLYGRFGSYRAELVPVGGDDFLVDWIDRNQPARLHMTFDAGGRASRMEWGERMFERMPQ